MRPSAAARAIPLCPLALLACAALALPACLAQTGQDGMASHSYSLADGVQVLAFIYLNNFETGPGTGTGSGTVTGTGTGTGDGVPSDEWGSGYDLSGFREETTAAAASSRNQVAMT